MFSCMGSDTERIVIGFMSGTSIDAVDGALIRARGAGLDLSVELIDAASEPIESERDVFRSAAMGGSITIESLLGAIHAFSDRHARVAQSLIARHGAPALVAVHGQTLFHRPPLSWQAIEPWRIALAAQAPVVFDLRSADFAAGGQGAPITPLADWLLFRSDDVSRAIVNLGGFCNVTILPARGAIEHIRAFDVCACNQTLDAVARRALDAPFDRDGSHALRGRAHPAAVAALQSMLSRQRESGRALGSGDEAADWVEVWRQRLDGGDLAASAVAAIGAVIGAAVDGADEIYLAGGGVRNEALVGAIAGAAGGQVKRTDELGVPAPWREAVAIGALGCLCADGVPITLTHITGASAAPVAGSWANAR